MNATVAATLIFIAFLQLEWLVLNNFNFKAY